MKQLREVEQNLRISAEAEQKLRQYLLKHEIPFPPQLVKPDDMPWEIEEIERTIIDYALRLVSRGGSPLGILKKFYKKIQPYYDFFMNILPAKKVVAVVVICMLIQIYWSAI